MSDERIDQIFRDLNKALSVEPSPGVAAKVRMRIEEGRVARTGWVGWAAVAAVGLVAVAYLFVPRKLEQTEPLTLTVAVPDASDVNDMSPALPEPLVAPEASAPARSRRATRVAAARAAALPTIPEPEVQVPPSVQLAYDALRRQIAEGRITSASFLPPREFEGPTIVRPTVLELVPLEIETIRLGSDPEESIVPFPSSETLDNTRSHS